MSERLLIVGGGMAATRLVDELTQIAPDRYAISVIGEETSLPYNRVLLSPYLAREIEESDLELKPRSWWEEREVDFLSGSPVERIETNARRVRLKSGACVSYDRLVLATGSEPIRLNLPGAARAGVLTFRTRADVAAMLMRARAKTRVAVIGGGLLGLEAAYGFRKAGLDVTVVHLMDRLMERQLDVRSAGMLKCALEALGISVLLQAESTAVERRKKIGGLRLADGRLVPADSIVMAAGIRPRSELAKRAGLAVGRGIIVDDRLCTSQPDIYAIGECAEHRGICYGLVEPAYEQARVLARHLAGRPARYRGSLLATNLKVSGIDLFSAGDFAGAPGTDTILFTDNDRGTYRKLVFKEQRLVGAVLLGDASDALWYLELIRSGACISAMRDRLIFGRALCTADNGPATQDRAEAA